MHAMLRRGVGGMVPYVDGYQGETKDLLDVSTLLTNSDINWDKRFRDGPLDHGFEDSFVTMGGIQGPPYGYFKDDLLVTKTGLCGACCSLD